MLQSVPAIRSRILQASAVVGGTSVETMYTLRKAPTGSLLFPELSVVEIVRDVETDNGQRVLAGSRGTIVMVYDGGRPTKWSSLGR